MEEKEVLAQMKFVFHDPTIQSLLKPRSSTIILAGHETTANSLTFAFFELCKQPEIQKRLRAEIRAMEKTSDYTASDFDNMPYLTAVVKVSAIDWHIQGSY